ncbi:MAG TPA: SAM-dependent chlorinase/fluorinase [Candidatus Methylomirabilis sp.]|nr:SAM-dependent chlorinase/fluorinase [Candidatus Methylomirabilis sp.]
MPPVVTLFTDFGHRDPFVGIMKGVILSVCPTAAVVDLCHETAAHDILGGSFLLLSAVRFFPAETIHVAVVDPGVGGPRRPILARIDDQLFVGPDNGLLSYPMASGTVQAVRVITAREYLLPQRSTTFHGRDVFAPVAGHLARGVPPDRFGPEIADPVRLPIPRPRRDPSGRLVGEIVWIDHFGNCVTNILGEDLEALAAGQTTRLRAILDGRAVGPIVQFFAEIAPGGGGGVIGSTGHLELFINQGHLARTWGVGTGASVVVDSESPIENVTFEM